MNNSLRPITLKSRSSDHSHKGRLRRAATLIATLSICAGSLANIHIGDVPVGQSRRDAVAMPYYFASRNDEDAFAQGRNFIFQGFRIERSSSSISVHRFLKRNRHTGATAEIREGHQFNKNHILLIDCTFSPASASYFDTAFRWLYTNPWGSRRSSRDNLWGRGIAPSRAYMDVQSVQLRDPITLDIHALVKLEGSGLTGRVRGHIDGKKFQFGFTPKNTQPRPGRMSDLVTEPISVVFPHNNIPRFKDDAPYSITVEILGGEQPVRRTVRGIIPLPTILVPGIAPPVGNMLLGDLFGPPGPALGGRGTWPAVESYLNSWCRGSQSGAAISSDFCGQSLEVTSPAGVSNRGDWRRPHGVATVDRPYYPIMHTLDFFNSPAWLGVNVDRNTSSFGHGAKLLLSQIDAIKSHTYADRVNIVAHSKGGLIARQLMVSSFFDGRQDVRRLALVQTPHMGNILPIVPVVQSFIQSVYGRNVYENLTPPEPYVEPWPKRNAPPLGKSLDKLNGILLPAGVGTRYLIFFSDSYRTASKFAGRINSDRFYLSWGDRIVSSDSQRALKIDQTTKKKRRVYAFKLAEDLGLVEESRLPSDASHSAVMGLESAIRQIFEKVRES